jgi:hypothetical protein
MAQPTLKKKLGIRPSMMNPYDFARKQTELMAEFGKYVLDHPEVDETLPEDSYVYFEIAGDSTFNKYSRELARRREREDGVNVVCVRVRGLAPPQGSRLIDPQILPASTAATDRVNRQAEPALHGAPLVAQSKDITVRERSELSSLRVGRAPGSPEAPPGVGIGAPASSRRGTVSALPGLDADGQPGCVLVPGGRRVDPGAGGQGGP